MSPDAGADVRQALAWYSPESWRQLEEAVQAAGLPRTMLAATYEEFIAMFDDVARRFRDEGIAYEKVTIDVPHMVKWCKRWGIKPDSMGRAKYGAALSLSGGAREELDRREFEDRTRTEH